MSKSEFIFNKEKVNFEQIEDKFIIEINGKGTLDQILDQFNLDEEVELKKELINFYDVSFKIVKEFYTVGNIKFSKYMTDLLFDKFMTKWSKLSNRGLSDKQLELWIKVFEMTIDWEKKNKHILDKGTAYFFLGATYLIREELDRGFACLYAGMEEDKRHAIEIKQPENYKKGAAYKTISLFDDKENALFTLIVEPTINTLKGLIADFNKEYKKKFSFELFSNKFIKNKYLEKEKSFFVYILLSVIHHTDILNNELGESLFVELKKMDTMTNLCLILEVIMAFIYKRNYLLDNIREYLKYTKNISTEEFNKILADNRLEQSDPHFSFEETINKILNNQVYSKNGVNDKEVSLFLLLRIIRNLGSHNISTERIISERYSEIIKRLLYCLFLISDKL